MAHYKIGKCNALFRKGKPVPPFFGPLVLLDYIAPKKAQAFRKLANQKPKLPPYPHWQDPEPPEYAVQEEKYRIAALAAKRRLLKRFAKLCEAPHA